MQQYRMKSGKFKVILFLASQAISLFGSSIVQFTMIWYITNETSSGVVVSLMTVCAFVPQMMISFISGVWADRHVKKRIIILADAMIAAATLALALMIPSIHNGTPLIIALMVTSAIRSLGTGIQQPAVNAFLPELVSQEKLMRVNGINATIQSVVQFVAPAVAAAVMSFGTMRGSLFIDIITAAVGISLLACICCPKGNTQTQEKPSMLTDVLLGAKYTFQNPFLGKLLLFFGLFILLCVPAGFMATLFVTRTYGNTYVNMSFVEVIGFIGMMLGGILISTWGGFHNRMKTLLVGLIAFGLLAIGMGAITNFIIYLVLMTIYGVALTMVQTATTTMIQEHTAADMQGRVFGLSNTIYSGFLPLGMLVFGPLADYVSLNLLMILSGVLLLVMAAFIFFSRHFYLNGIPAPKETDV